MYGTDVYSNPGKNGLEIVDVLDPDIGYEFDMLVVWRKLDDGTLYYANDSGCSCPSPFEGFGFDDLVVLTRDNYDDFSKSVTDMNVEGVEKTECLAKVWQLLSS